MMSKNLKNSRQILALKNANKCHEKHVKVGDIYNKEYTPCNTNAIPKGIKGFNFLFLAFSMTLNKKHSFRISNVFRKQ